MAMSEYRRSARQQVMALKLIGEHAPLARHILVQVYSFSVVSILSQLLTLFSFRQVMLQSRVHDGTSRHNNRGRSIPFRERVELSTLNIGQIEPNKLCPYCEQSQSFALPALGAP